MSALVTRTGGSIMGLSMYILCYPDPEVPLWNCQPMCLP
ncbi:hypothetical protein CsSME_00025868 [Camellia sinensis var. sinensis]